MIRSRSPTTYYGSGQFIGEVVSHATADPVSGDRGVVINLVDVPIAQASKEILGDSLGLNYTVDPHLTGKVTIQTSHAVSKALLARMFEGALRSTGAALMRNGAGYEVVPLDEAGNASSLQASVDDSNESFGSGLQIISLHFVSADEMIRILQPIAPHGSIVRAEGTRNALAVSGTPQDIAAVHDAISLFDVDVMRGMSFALVPVSTSQPSDIADELRTIFDSGKDGPMTGMVQFLPNTRLRSILVISKQARYLARAEGWIHRLDAQAHGQEQQYYTYAVQNRSADELVPILQAMFGQTSGSSQSPRNVAPRYQSSDVQSSTQNQSSAPFGSVSSAESGFGAIGGVLNPQDSSGHDSGQTGVTTSTVSLTQDGNKGGSSTTRIVADDANNSVIIVATPTEYHHIHEILENLDIPPTQVLIEATIAEVTLNDNLQFGLRWYFQHQQSAATFTDDAGGALSSVFPGFSYALAAANAQITLNALQAITDVNVLSAPSLMVRDNKTAYLQIGDEVPITTQSAVSTLSTGSVVNSVTYKDTGVILSVTPRVNQSGQVLLDIEQEVSSVEPTTSSSIDSPTIQERRVRTTVEVNDSATLALGGMIQEGKSVVTTQIPIVGNIPGVGNLFKQKNDTRTKTELIVLITPHVVRNSEQARGVTEEFREQLNVLIPHAHAGSRNLIENVQRTFE